MRNYTSVSRESVIHISSDECLVGFTYQVRGAPLGLQKTDWTQHTELLNAVCRIQENVSDEQRTETSRLLRGVMSRWAVRALTPAETRQIREIRAFVLRVHRCGEEGPVTCHVENLNTGKVLSLINVSYMMDMFG